MQSIISCLRRPEAYTRRSAVEALSKIAEKGRSHIEPATPILKEIAEKDPEEKTRRKAVKLLRDMGL